jgi:hypothetical protein
VARKLDAIIEILEQMRDKLEVLEETRDTDSSDDDFDE